MNGRAYYNEIDGYAADWLENLIAAKLIAAGDVDRRSIVDVRPGDVAGYGQCHFFAGIGGWSLALRLAGWPDDRPVWTGSCPCQPFSAAGKGEAADDERHLWPAWLPLIAERRPAILFGEQVEATDSSRKTVELCSWPTPCAIEPVQGSNHQRHTKTRAERGGGGMLNLATAASYAAWPTPTRQDGASSGAMNYSTESGRHPGTTLTDAASLASWPTSNAEDAKAGQSQIPRKQSSLPRTAAWATPTANEKRRREDFQEGRSLNAAEALGLKPTGSHVGTAKVGQLSPAHSLWLQGYPRAWLDCAPPGTRSSRRSRQNSSEPIASVSHD